MANTYDRRTQRLASERRYQDAIALRSAGRWNGAIYPGGYAIECSLKSLICYIEGKIVVTETKMFKGGVQGANLHNLGRLLEYARFDANSMMRADRTGKLNEASRIVVDLNDIIYVESRVTPFAELTHRHKEKSKEEKDGSPTCS